jgi:hypothetical protein
MRRTGMWLALFGLGVTAGCSADQRCRTARNGAAPPARWYVEAPCSPTPNLLFDRTLQPARPQITAQDFAYRSDWPSTPGYYSGGEAVFYRSWYFSDQGDAFSNFDYVTRQFQSYRYGTLFR